MVNYVVKCRVCGAYGPFLIRPEDQAQFSEEAQPSGPVEHFCPNCQKKTLWSVVFPDRRVANNPQSGWRRRSEDL